ncbi:MAG: motility associated factor glycosyltransferase family protein [Alphaproteobacteria bacterium]|jgi:hypothetical protein|nr:motility associated factor glycosyltransferase family protein [Alphaproteobacteria bacterium]
MPAASDTLLAANLAAVKERYPRVYEQITTVLSASRIVGMEGGPALNLDLGHTAFYEGGAEAYLEEQWARYIKRPDRLNLTLPREPKEVSRLPHIVQKGIFRHFKAENISDVHMLPREKTGFMIVFGVGLGLHLNRLASEFEFRNLVIVEQFPEFIYHSLYFVDWTRIFAKIDENGGKLTFYIGDNPDEIGQAVHYHLRNIDFGLVDGSYIYRHYSSFLLDGAFDHFVKQIPLQLISKGFFEDEIIMMRNTFQNLIRYDFDLLEPAPRLLKETPILILGSGPSIDRSFELIRKLRDKVVLLSCGTTLRVLLRNGIVPHYHCELENVPAVFEHLEPLSQEFDLSGITLIATTTVDPRVPGMFGKRMLYFRDALSSTILFGSLDKAVYGGAPNVSNLGTRIAVMLGFRRIYFVGVDLGSRRKDVHHAKDAVYNKEWTKTYTRLIEPMKIELPANFGGKAFTNSILLWARTMLQNLLKGFPDRQFFNCSDGIKIVGTAPLLPTQFATQAEGLPSNQNDLAQIGKEVSACSPRDLLKRERIVEAKENFAAWREKLNEITVQAREEQWDFFKLYDAIAARLDRKGNFADAELIAAVTLGSMMMVLQFAYFFAHRLDVDLRRGFMEELLNRLDETLDKIIVDIHELYDGFIAELDATGAAA